MTRRGGIEAMERSGIKKDERPSVEAFQFGDIGNA